MDESMSDNLDIASEREELDRSMALAKALRQPAGPTATGQCLYCGQGFLNLRLRWCDADCRDEWEVLTKQKR